MMILPEPYYVEICSWTEHQQELANIRYAVFVEEQRVPAEIEQDAFDAGAVHAVARVNQGGTAIATGRMILEGRLPRIGRMAVLRPWRKAGVGASILHLLAMRRRRAVFAK